MSFKKISKKKIIVSERVLKRFKNEIVALIFFEKCFTIFVPKVYREFELDEIHCIIMKYIKNDFLANFEESFKSIVIEKLQNHIKTMHFISISQINDVSSFDFVCFFYKISRVAQIDKNELKSFEFDELKFCHNDFSQHNVLMNSETHVIQTIIDFEYFDFYSFFFENQFYRRVNSSIALNEKNDDTNRLINFINSHKIDTLNCYVA